jgi:hypothetical protein
VKKTGIFGIEKGIWRRMRRKTKKEKGKNGCFTPTHTEAYKGRLVTLY